MDLHGQITMTFQIYRRVVRAAGGAGVWVFRGFGVLMLLMVGMYLVRGVGDDGITLAGMFLLGLLFLFLYELFALLGWRRLSGWVDEPWRYRVADNGVGVHTPRSDVTLRWDAVAKVRTTPDAWVLRTTSKARVPVPRAAFAEADAEQVDRLFTSRAGATRA